MAAPKMRTDTKAPRHPALSPAGIPPRSLARTCFAALALLTLPAFFPHMGPARAGLPAQARIFILSSVRIRPYEALARSIARELKGYRVDTRFLDESAGSLREISSASPPPACIVTIGQEALQKVLPLRGSAGLVYTMVLNPKEIIPPGATGTAGVAMIPSPRQQLLVLQKGFHLKRVTVYSNPSISGDLMRDMESMAPEGLDITTLAVKTDGELLRSLEAGIPSTDGMLLIPDPTLLTEESLKKLVNACFLKKVPLFGFSPIYLEMGAVATVSVTEEAVARKAAGLVRGEANGSSDQVESLYYLRKCVIHLNENARNRLSLTPDRANLNLLGQLVERSG